MNTVQPNVPGVNVPQLQTRRFTESLNEIIVPKHDSKLKFEKGILVAAKANTNRPLNSATLNHLIYFADSWNQELSLTRSGEGIRIEFKIKK
ncbi:hypothetical protein ML462_13930 [Gramella lutea]|uniref:Uncharacterized protein n=1 Tax=Christiangramia lutea TaxID=1607951 RepID=A0A9X1V5Y8_9FLAO|nr:hypothetical protein [Christiangramia lutea]MCH4824271.1 hypothetical protein [Christiangramia lutea]